MALLGGSQAFVRVQLLDALVHHDFATIHESVSSQQHSFAQQFFFSASDPIFRFVPTNAKLGDVSNAHKATLNVVCPAEATATTGTLVFDDKSTVEVEEVTSDNCGARANRTDLAL